MSKKSKALKAVEPVEYLRLDIGCGKSKQAGYIGVDIRAFDGVDVVADLTKPWPWKDGSVEHVHCSHFVEHLTAPERIHFVNELYRVLRDGGTAYIVTPHWASTRAYGDLTHQWPPVSEMWFYYLSKQWRESQAPHNDQYNCNFEATWGYGVHEALRSRNQDFVNEALLWKKEAATDLLATLTKKVV